MSSTTFNKVTVSLKKQENTNLKAVGNLGCAAEPCNNMQAVGSKRKRGADDGEVPIQRSPTNVDGQPPTKKSRCGVKTSEPKPASEKNCQLQTGKRKASGDGETPQKKARLDEASSKPGTSLKKKPICVANPSRVDFYKKYRKLHLIGKGGYGSVYAGFRKADRLPVAIKHIPLARALREEVTRNGTSYRQFLEVTFMMATGGFPDSVGLYPAVTLLDWYNFDGQLTLVMERPENAVDLFDYCQSRGGHLDEEEAKMILKQMVEAAIYMHSKGVFHRDIKLQNVLIHAGFTGPRARIIDFGCAAHSTEEPFRSFSGTFPIAPPEWFERETYWAQSTTVWQLGVLFYTLLDHHRAFITRDFMKKDIQINHTLSEDVKTLLEKCLAINPEERATLEDLEQILQ